jgi:hypothetical protein
LISNVFFIIFAANKIINDMDLMNKVKNASYNVIIDDITYPKDDVKTTKFEITLSEEDGKYGTIVMSIVSTSKDNTISPVENKVTDDILIRNWIDREDKLPLLLNCISKFYLKNKSKIELDDLTTLFHFAVGMFFCFDISCQSFSEHFINVRKFTASFKPCREKEVALYDEIINYFSERDM